MKLFRYLFDRLCEGKARAAAFRNRWFYHYDLAWDYFMVDTEDKSAIALNMMMADRDKHRASNSKKPYPIVWDYHIPPGRFGWEMAKARRADRQRDLDEIQRHLKAVRKQ